MRIILPGKSNKTPIRNFFRWLFHRGPKLQPQFISTARPHEDHSGPRILAVGQPKFRWWGRLKT